MGHTPETLRTTRALAALKQRVMILFTAAEFADPVLHIEGRLFAAD